MCSVKAVRTALSSGSSTTTKSKRDREKGYQTSDTMETEGINYAHCHWIGGRWSAIGLHYDLGRKTQSPS